MANNFNYSRVCFWCTEADPEKLEGVTEVISGFTGGTTPSPHYESGRWGDHTEVAQIIYDPTVIPYEDLVTMKVSFAMKAGPKALRFISKQKKSVW